MTSLNTLGEEVCTRRWDIMGTALLLTELSAAYDMLSADERDDILQSLLIAVSREGGAMVKVVEQTLLCHATEELLGVMGDPQSPAGAE